MIYGYSVPATSKSDCWTVVLAIVRVIWNELKKAQVEAYMAYGLYSPSAMIGCYLWGTIQAHWVMYDFLWNQFWKHT